MIPKVKTWSIRFYDMDGNLLDKCEVKAPTQVLARLNHVHSCIHPRMAAVRVTYTVKRNTSRN